MNRQQVHARLMAVLPDPRSFEAGSGSGATDRPGDAQGKSLRPAAVLVPLIDAPEAMRVLFTVRTSTLRDYAGHVAFPGGSMHGGDRDVVATALRETEEELGIPADFIDVIGRLDRFQTRTGFDITPIVGFVRSPHPLTPNPDEVVDVFEVPLDHVVELSHYTWQPREGDTRKRSGYVLVYEGRRIWGATAAMLVNLAEHLQCL